MNERINSGIPSQDTLALKDFPQNTEKEMSRLTCILYNDIGEKYLISNLIPPLQISQTIEVLTSQDVTLNFQNAIVRKQGESENKLVKYNAIANTNGKSVVWVLYNGAVLYRGIVVELQYNTNSIAMTIQPKTSPLMVSTFKYRKNNFTAYDNIYDILKNILQEMGYVVTDNPNRHEKYNHINIVANVKNIQAVKVNKNNNGRDIEYEVNLDGERVNAKSGSLIAGISQRVGEFLMSIANNIGILIYTNTDGDIVLSRVDKLLEEADNQLNKKPIVSAVLLPNDEPLLDEYKTNIIANENGPSYTIRDGIKGRFYTYQGLVAKPEVDDEGLIIIDTTEDNEVITSLDKNVSPLFHLTAQVINTLNPTIALKMQQQTVLALEARQNIIMVTMAGLCYDSAWNSDSTDFFKINDTRELVLVSPTHDDIQKIVLIYDLTYIIDKTQITTQMTLVSPNYYLNIGFNARTQSARFRKRIRKRTRS